MATTTKKNLIDRISADTKVKRSTVKSIVQKFLNQMADELGHGNRIEFRDFGVFEIKDRAPRTAQNPKTLQRVQVPAKRTVKFKVGRLLRDRMEASPVQPKPAATAASPSASEDGHSVEVKIKPKRNAGAAV